MARRASRETLNMEGSREDLLWSHESVQLAVVDIGPRSNAPLECYVPDLAEFFANLAHESSGIRFDCLTPC